MKVRVSTALAAVLVVLGYVSAAVAQPAVATPIDSKRFESDIAAFEADDYSMMPPKGAIVITGSSSIRRWSSMRADLAPLTVIPRGFGGSAMADVLHFVDRIIIPYAPRAVVIYEGDNDIWTHQLSPETVADQLGQIVSRIHTSLPQTRVYVMSVKPSLQRWDVWDKAQETNMLYRKLVAEDDLVSYIDVATPFLGPDGKVMDDIFIEDGLHLNEKGTGIWAATVKAALMAVEAQYETRSSGN